MVVSCSHWVVSTYNVWTFVAQHSARTNNELLLLLCMWYTLHRSLYARPGVHRYIWHVSQTRQIGDRHPNDSSRLIIAVHSIYINTYFSQTKFMYARNMCCDFVVESRAITTPRPILQLCTCVSVCGCLCGKVELNCSFRLCGVVCWCVQQAWVSEWQIDCRLWAICELYCIMNGGRRACEARLSTV